MAEKRGKMPDADLRALVNREITNSQGAFGGQLAQERRENLDYYNSEPFGNEVKGRSQVVTSDVLETIEPLMAALVEIFIGGDRVIVYEPVDKEDENFAEQASDYANHIVLKDNPGYVLIHDWLKDALISKNGFLKVYWHEYDKTRVETRSDEPEDLFVQFVTEQESSKEKGRKFKVLEKTYFQVISPEGEKEEIDDPETATGPVVVDFKYELTEKQGRVRIEAVPPEEMLISRRARDLQWYGHDNEASFVGHETRKTETQLIEAGHDEETIKKLPSYGGTAWTEERHNRHKEDDSQAGVDERTDRGMREIRVVEGYLQVDYDGDGKAEYREITIAGEGSSTEILDNEEVDDHPFVSLTPIRMPHKVIGKALADLAKDNQLIKSTLFRQILDNAYNINNGRTAVNERVMLADALSPRPNQVVRIKGEGPVGDAIAAIYPNPIAQHLFPILEYCDNWKELKTGVSRLNQGVDADTLQDTARGVALLQNAGNQRVKFMARTFAETGFTDLARKIIRIVIDHQDKPRTIRLRNQWVEMDPQSWNAEMDVTVSVGVGYGNKQQETMLLGMLGQVFEKIMAYQGGLEGPILKLRGMKSLIDKQIASIGFKPNTFLEDLPDDYKEPSKQPQPDPKMIEVQLEHQRELMKLQFTQQLEREKLGFEVQEMNLEHMREMAKLDMEAAEGAIKLSIEDRKAKASTKIAAQGAKAKADIAAYSAKRKADQPSAARTK